MTTDKIPQPISKQTLKRLPDYVAFLKSEACYGLTGVSAGRIAGALGLSEIQVRKDLAAISTLGGKPKLGFDKRQLISDIESFLGFDNVDRAVLVGTGRLGAALLHYEGFSNCGVEIVSAFDRDEALCGKEVNGVKILNISKLGTICRRLNVHIGIITTAANAAQEVCDTLVGAGVLAIWNFAPIKLKVPCNILVRDENMSSSLTMLSHHLAQSLKTQL